MRGRRAVRRGLVRGVAAAPIYDPAVLSLTGWWRASYSGSPWTGTASAGTSGSRNLTEATNPPGTFTVGAYDAADLDGTNDVLTGAAMTNFMNVSAYTMIALINVDAFTVADPGAAAPYDCPTLFCGSDGNGGPCGGVAGTGAAGVFRFGHHDGGWKSAAVAISTATWTMVAARYNGTNIEVSKNAGAWTATAAGNASANTALMKLGKAFGATFLNGKVLEGMTANAALDDADISSVKSYLNSRYGLSI